MLRERIIHGDDPSFRAKQVFLSSPADLPNIPQDACVVHLAGQNMVKRSVIEQVLSQNPGVQVIEVPASLAQRMLSTAARQSLAGRGIELREDRYYTRRTEYDGGRVSDFKEKRKAFEDLARDPKKGPYFEKMREYGFMEAELAILYYTGEIKSVSEVCRILSRKHGVHYMLNAVQRKLATFNHWIGFASKNREVIKAAGKLEARVEGIDKQRKVPKLQETKKIELEAARRAFRVGEKLPPEELEPRRWRVWQQINVIMLADPDVLGKLRGISPPAWEATVNFYRLPGGRGKSLRQVARERGVRPQAAFYNRDAGLEILGLER